MFQIFQEQNFQRGKLKLLPRVPTFPILTDHMASENYRRYGLYWLEISKQLSKIDNQTRLVTDKLEKWQEGSCIKSDWVHKKAFLAIQIKLAATVLQCALESVEQRVDIKQSVGNSGNISTILDIPFTNSRIRRRL